MATYWYIWKATCPNFVAAIKSPANPLCVERKEIVLFVCSGSYFYDSISLVQDCAHSLYRWIPLRHKLPHGLDSVKHFY